jgi:hypothetical protein
MTMHPWSQLEAVLGHALAPEAHESVASLNELPDDVIQTARRLPSPMLKRQWLEYHCGAACRPWLSSFIVAVIEGGERADAWNREVGLVPAPSLADQLRLDRAALLAPIGGFHGQRVVPDRGSWESGTSWIGAPVFARRDADYRDPTPEGATDLIKPVVESVQDEDVTVRRWIASRLARCVAASALTDVETLFAATPALPAFHAWSADARIALSALLRETRECPQDDATIPGFRGPDAWYRDDGA